MSNKQLEPMKEEIKNHDGISLASANSLVSENSLVSAEEITQSSALAPLDNESLEVVKEKTVKKEDPVYTSILNRKEKFLPLLDNNSIRLEKLARSFVFALHKNNLNNLNALSLIEGFIKLCELNLDLSGNGKVYLINYRGSLNVQIGYQGYLELLWRSNLVANVYSNIVYEGDEFEVEYGPRTNFSHKPKFESNQLKLTYAVVVFKSGDVQIKVATKKEIDESKALSKSSESHSSPWNKHYDAMAQVVPLRKISKNLALAIRQDDEFEGAEADQGLS